MQGIYKDNGWWQTQAARKDWDYLAQFAKENGLGHVADEYAPQPLHGWRVIDKQIATLRGILKDNGFDVPPSPSNTVAFAEWEQKQEQGKQLPTDQQLRRAGMPTLPGLE